MKRLLAFTLTLCLPALVVQAAPPADDKAEVKEALQALQDFIGEWQASGSPDKPRIDPRDPTWKETLSWAWRFKGDDAWLTLQVKNGKLLKSAELRYLPAKKKYELTAIGADDKKRVFEGEIKNETLRLERSDPDTKEVQQIAMNTAAEGIRFIYRVAHKPAGSTLVRRDYLVAATKEGESLAAKEKKNECVVSGGLGTITISYKGETYYVCCSGCRDAFNENPEKFIAEFKAKKAGKK
jgi:YHS domain-containing protein